MHQADYKSRQVTMHSEESFFLHINTILSTSGMIYFYPLQFCNKNNRLGSQVKIIPIFI